MTLAVQAKKLCISRSPAEGKVSIPCFPLFFPFWGVGSGGGESQVSRCMLMRSQPWKKVVFSSKITSIFKQKVISKWQQELKQHIVGFWRAVFFMWFLGWKGLAAVLCDRKGGDLVISWAYSPSLIKTGSIWIICLHLCEYIKICMQTHIKWSHQKY